MSLENELKKNTEALIANTNALAANEKERVTIDQYTSFRKSPYAHAGLTCESCHQQEYVNMDGYPTVGHMYLGSGASLPYDNQLDDQTFRASRLAFSPGLETSAWTSGPEVYHFALTPWASPIFRIRLTADHPK